MRRDKHIVVYHGGCIDGFTSAWVAWRYMLSQGIDAEYYPAYFGGEVPDVRDKHVYMLDFSYPREQILAMKALAKSFLILDHHKTAEENLKGLPFAKFDMKRIAIASKRAGSQRIKKCARAMARSRYLTKPNMMARPKIAPKNAVMPPTLRLCIAVALLAPSGGGPRSNQTPTRRITVIKSKTRSKKMVAKAAEAENPSLRASR